MNEQGIEEFKAEWASSGYGLPFGWKHTADPRDEGLLGFIGGVWIYFREHLVALPISTYGLGSKSPEGWLDPVGGSIGSLDVIIVTDAGNGIVKFEVTNVMGWASALRFPGTNRTIALNSSRERTIFGGTIVQRFYWWEPLPAQ
jgi:hypothetical protein